MCLMRLRLVSLRFKNCNCEKNEITKHCWKADPKFSCDQKKVADTESRLIPRKIKETIHSSRNPNHCNEISYMFPKIWFPNFYFLVTYLLIPVDSN